jgi:hypothetical protein
VRYTVIIIAVLFLAVGTAQAAVTHQGMIQAQQVDPAVVAQAAQLPGADNEGVFPLLAPTANNPYVCFETGPAPSDDLWTSWSQWPTVQKVYEHRYWCGYLNQYQTSRSSHPYTGGGPICGGSGAGSFRVGGGNGNFYTDVRSYAHFVCTPYGNFDDYQVWRCNMGGWCSWQYAGRT